MLCSGKEIGNRACNFQKEPEIEIEAQEDLIGEPELISNYESCEAIQGTNEHACSI